MGDESKGPVGAGLAPALFKVTFFQRKPRAYGNFSIENIFDTIKVSLSKKINIITSISTYESNGFFKRLYNCIEVVSRQGDVNHITGDVHFLATFLKKRKTVLTVLDCGRLIELSGIKQKIFKYFWFTIPVAKSRFITTISTATKTDLLKYVKCDPEKVIVVPVCILPLFTRSDKVFNKITPRILQMGTAPNKNISRLVEGLKGISCQLIIIGKVDAVLLEQLTRNNISHQIITGISNEAVFEEYKKADIITLVSTLEGFGMPILEGNAVGRVVITANNTSMPEVAGNAAHLVDANSIEDIHNGFLKIINDDIYREKLIENGFENCKKYSVASVAGQYLKVYEKVVNN